MPHIIGLARGKVTLPDGTTWRCGARFPFDDPELAAMALIAEDLDAYMALTYASTAVGTAIIATVTATAIAMSIHTGSPATTARTRSPTTVPAATPSPYAPLSPGQPMGPPRRSSNDTQTYTMGASWTPVPIPYFGFFTATTSGTWLFGGPTSGLSGNIPAGANVTFTSAVTLSTSA